jgi:hypothetical protein
MKLGFSAHSNSTPISERHKIRENLNTGVMLRIFLACWTLLVHLKLKLKKDADRII